MNKSLFITVGIVALCASGLQASEFDGLAFMEKDFTKEAHVEVYEQQKEALVNKLKPTEVNEEASESKEQVEQKEENVAVLNQVSTETETVIKNEEASESKETESEQNAQTEEKNDSEKPSFFFECSLSQVAGTVAIVAVTGGACYKLYTYIKANDINVTDLFKKCLVLPTLTKKNVAIAGTVAAAAVAAGSYYFFAGNSEEVVAQLVTQ